MPERTQTSTQKPGQKLGLKFHVMTQAVFATFAFGVLLSAPATASELQCEHLFVTGPVRIHGVLEQAIERDEATTERQREQAQATLQRLDLATDGWWPLDAKLISKIETQILKFRSLDQKTPVSPNRRQKNISESRRQLYALVYGADAFKGLSPAKLNALVDRLISDSDTSSQNVINSAKHILYRAMHFEAANPSIVLRDAILRLDAQAFLINKLENHRLKTLRTLVAARGAKDLPQLLERRDEMAETVRALIEKTQPVPDALVQTVIALAQEYRSARTKGASVDRIVARWNSIIQNDVFFDGLADGDGQAIGIEWTKVTSPQDTIKMFVMNTSAGSPTLALRFRDLDEMNVAVRYLTSDVKSAD